MIILVILLLLFGLSIQVVMTRIHKRNIIKKDYNALNIVLYMDAIATLLFILSVHLGAPNYIKLIFEYLVMLSMGIFFLICTRVLKTGPSSFKKGFKFIVTMLSLLLIMIFGIYMDKIITQVLLMIILLVRGLLVDYKKVFSSKNIKAIFYLLFITEAVRYVTQAFIISDLLYYDFSDTWISAFSFVLRAVSVMFVINLHDRLSINKNLAKTLDYQSATVLLSQVFDQNPNVVILTDINHKIIYINPQTLTYTGYEEAHIIGKTPKLFSSKFTPKSTFLELENALSKGESWSGEFTNRRKNGEIYIEQSKIMVLKDVNGVPIFYLAIKTDITTEKAYLKELEYRSAYDDLTGLLRRQVFIQRFETNIEMNHEMNHYFIIMDIDEFKHINDTYGHLTGDDVLTEFSDTLKSIFSTKAYICRFGGDEFAVYLYDIQPEEVLDLLLKLQRKLDNTPTKSISPDYKLQFSSGVTHIEVPFDFSKIYEIADRKLYMNKALKNNIRR